MIKLNNFDALQKQFDYHKKVFRTRMTPKGQKLTIELKSGGHIIFDNPGGLYIRIWDGKSKRKHPWRNDLINDEITVQVERKYEEWPMVTEIKDDYFVIAKEICILIS